MPKNFKVLLVYPNLQMVNLLPANIAILSGALKNAGIQVKLFDTTFYKTSEKSVDDIRVQHLQLRPFNLREKGVDYKTTDIFHDFTKTVDEYNPDLIGVTTTDITHELGIALIRKIKQKNCHIIFGGIYPTFSPEKALSEESIDSVCLGEGEEALLELCRHLQSGKDIRLIKNLWVKADGKIYKNDLREPVDLNLLPKEDFSVFEEKRFFRPMQGKIYRMIPVCIDRGCPFSCSFCAAPLQRKLYQDAGQKTYFRAKTIEKVIDEMKSAIKEYKADYIYFNSETFFARKEEEIEEFGKIYSRDIGLPFWCQTRIETITEKRIKLLENMNCDRISIGLEHGNEKFRKTMLKKAFTNKMVIDNFRLLAKSRIPVTVNNIIGFPDETRELVFDTINLNRKITADSINAFFFVPYSGTFLRQYSIEKGYIPADKSNFSPMIGSVLDMPQLTADQIMGLVRTFPLYVKMPREHFTKIAAAEQLNKEGNAAFLELSEVFFKQYF